MRRGPVLLLAIVVSTLGWSAIRPYRLGTWFSETIWVIAALAVILVLWRRFPLTSLLCTVLAVQFVVLAYGGHYTYARAPLGEWAQQLLGLARNPFDRVGHFLQGIAPGIAIREILWRRSPLRYSRWLNPLTVCLALAFSAAWELLEWCGAYAVAGGDPGFLGSQGDSWDTQWDMALALLGALLAVATLGRWHDRQLERFTAAAGRQR